LPPNFRPGIGIKIANSTHWRRSMGRRSGTAPAFKHPAKQLNSRESPPA
jgi:hypothetical protein